MALTDTKIKNAKPEEKPYKMGDTGGLYLLINPSGSKYWRYKYRFAGKEKNLAIGVYPAVSLKDARVKHMEAKEQLQDGIDPMEDKKAAKAAQAITHRNSFKLVAQAWYEQWKPNKSEKHSKKILKWLETDVFPEIGDTPITELTASKFKDLVKKVEKRGVSETAKRILQTCGLIMRYAVAHDFIPHNPTSDVKPSDILPKRRKRNYQRVALNELPQLLRDIDNYIGNEVTILAIRMMAYTFVRTGELIGARWEEFDLQSRRWNIPADRMKMDRPHIVPLAEQVISILNEMKRYDNGSGFVFPADTYGKGKHMSNNTILYALYRMGYRGRMTGHGFRGIASTALHEQDFNHNHIEAQLAHIEGDGETSGAYNYAEYLPQRTKMMQAWADYLDAIKKENIILFPAKTA
ncbi:MAG: integrase arm-type DNA-binding domain-containing protein [Desulfotomaculaceae bacterium]